MALHNTRRRRASFRKTSEGGKDKNMLERLEDIAKLPATKQTELFNVMDAYLRDYRTSKAYAK